MDWASPHLSICQVLREIYFTTDDPNTKLRCRLATAMAKAMTAKLETYKKEWEKEFWDTNPHFSQQVGTHATYLPERGRSMRSKSGKPFDVFVFCQDDWANSGYRYSKCLRHLGLNVMAFKMNPHPFFYPETLPTYPVVTAEAIQKFVDDSHVVVLHNSTVSEQINLSGKIVVAQHGGSVYRQHHKRINAYLNDRIQATIIQCPDLLGLGAKNEHWITYPVDTDFIRPIHRPPDGKIKIGHFPSNPQVKGTAAICEVIDAIKNPAFEYIGARPETAFRGIKSWSENLDRIAECDVYIECLNGNINGNPYGEFGNQALEAAAMGKLVITNCLNMERYAAEYGDPFFVVANTRQELSDVLKRLPEAWDGRARVERHHSIPATAERLWKLVYAEFF